MKTNNFLLIAKQVIKNLFFVLLPLVMVVYFSVLCISGSDLFLDEAGRLEPLWLRVVLVVLADFLFLLIFLRNLCDSFVINKKRYFRIPILCLYSKTLIDTEGTIFKIGIKKRVRFIVAISEDFDIKIIEEIVREERHVPILESDYSKFFHYYETSSWDEMIVYILENRIFSTGTEISFFNELKKESSTREEEIINKKISSLNGKINVIKQQIGLIC